METTIMGLYYIGFRVWGLGLGVWGLGFRVATPKGGLFKPYYRGSQKVFGLGFRGSGLGLKKAYIDLDLNTSLVCALYGYPYPPGGVLDTRCEAVATDAGAMHLGSTSSRG